MGELSRVIVEITRKESKLDHIREYIMRTICVKWMERNKVGATEIGSM